MKVLRTLRNYLFYCGIEKDEYNAVKKEAYKSNFIVWRYLHFLMTAVFCGLFITSLSSELLRRNSMFYLFGMIYSLTALLFFFLLKRDSLAGQLLIYMSISVLFLFGCFITQNKPEDPATTFIVFLLITPMFMIDKPFYMAIELIVASGIFLSWMYQVKTRDAWALDVINSITYTTVGIFLNIIANSIRIKEFVLTREINRQKDTDEMTGLNNKGALTRKINDYLKDDSKSKGIMFLMDVDRFKAINDTYGHDIGDLVIQQLGRFLGSRFNKGEIVGRFGGDEFILFVKDTDDPETAGRIAGDIIRGVSKEVQVPECGQKISVSIGIAIYEGRENNYSEVFKKADMALYRSKADQENRFCIYEDSTI